MVFQVRGEHGGAPLLHLCVPAAGDGVLAAPPHHAPHHALRVAAVLGRHAPASAAAWLRADPGV